MNSLHSALKDYLALRRGLGYKMRDAGRLLPRFVSFLEARHEPHITSQSALQWAQQADVQPAPDSLGDHQSVGRPHRADSRNCRFVMRASTTATS